MRSATAAQGAAAHGGTGGGSRATAALRSGAGSYARGDPTRRRAPRRLRSWAWVATTPAPWRTRERCAHWMVRCAVAASVRRTVCDDERAPARARLIR